MYRLPEQGGSAVEHQAGQGDEVQAGDGGRQALVAAGEPPQAGEPLNFFIYPYAEADGKVVKTSYSFTYKDVEP